VNKSELNIFSTSGNSIKNNEIVGWEKPKMKEKREAR